MPVRGAVVSTSRCPVLLASEMSGLHRKVHPRRRASGGCTRGRQPSCGGSRCIDACQRFGLARSMLAAWGEPARPGFPPEGETGKGAFPFLAAAGVHCLQLSAKKRIRIARGFVPSLSGPRAPLAGLPERPGGGMGTPRSCGLRRLFAAGIYEPAANPKNYKLVSHNPIARGRRRSP